MSNSGYEDVRKTIANSINKKYELNIDEQSIVMTCGAAGGLNIIFKSILEEGDEVIVLLLIYWWCEWQSTHYLPKHAKVT